MTRDHLHDTLPDQPAEVVEDMEETPTRDGARTRAPPAEHRTAATLDAFAPLPGPSTAAPTPFASTEQPEFLAYSRAGVPPTVPGQHATVGPSDAPVAFGAGSGGRWGRTEPAHDRGSGRTPSSAASRWRVGLFIAAVAGLMGAVLRVTLGDGTDVRPATATWGQPATSAPTLDVPTERLAPIATDELPSRTSPPSEVLVPPPPPASTASTQAPSVHRAPAAPVAPTWTAAPARASSSEHASSTPPAAMPCAPAATPPALAPCVPSDKLIEHPW